MQVGVVTAQFNLAQDMVSL